MSGYNDNNYSHYRAPAGASYNNYSNTRVNPSSTASSRYQAQQTTTSGPSLTGYAASQEPYRHSQYDATNSVTPASNRQFPEYSSRTAPSAPRSQHAHLPHPQSQTQPQTQTQTVVSSRHAFQPSTSQMDRQQARTTDYTNYNQPHAQTQPTHASCVTNTTHNDYTQPQPRTSSYASNARTNTNQAQASYRLIEDSTHVTVDPSQVYDASHEYLHQIALAEKESARKADEARKLEEARKAEQTKLVAERKRQDKEKVTPTAKTGPLPAEAGTQKTKRPRKPRRPRTSGANMQTSREQAGGDAHQSQTAQVEAAMTLMQAANSTAGGTSLAHDKAALEAQMREMFARMREFNQADPEMLSRLWQQEREEHLAKSTEPAREAATTLSPAQSRTAAPQQSHPSQAPTPKKKPQGPKSTKKSTPGKQAPQVSGVEKPALSGGQSSKHPGSAPKATTQPEIPPTTSTNPSEKPATVWPPEKKAALAQAVSNLLREMPGNESKHVSPGEVATLLNANPSYAQLCDEIEKRGLKVDRNKFAKALLVAVPDVSKARPAQIPHVEAVGSTPATQRGAQALADAQKRILDGQGLVESASTSSVHLPSVSSLALGKKKKKKKKKQQGSASKAPRDSPPAYVPEDDIAPGGLHGLEAVQQYVDGRWVERDAAPPVSNTKAKGKSKQNRQSVSVAPLPPTKQDLARKRTFADLIDLTKADSSDDDLYTSFAPPSKRHDTATQVPSPPETSGLENTPPATARDEAQSGQFTVSPQKQQGPTVQQPALMRPPAPLKAAAPAVPTLPADHPARKTVLIQPLDKYKANRRNAYDPRTIARDVLLASGRHPDLRHLNAHLESLRQLPGIDIGSDLSTFRWDLVDPGGPAPGSGAEVLQQAAPLEEFADDEDSDDDSVIVGRNEALQTIAAGGSSVTASRRGGAALGPSNGKRGRAKKLGEPVLRTAAGPGSNRTTGTYAALREQQAAQSGGSAVKKMGRPVGWRKWMMADPSSYKGAAGNRQSKPTAPTRAKSPSPHYAVYKCEWKECTAELHNLATLRRHIHKNYGKPQEDTKFHCHWRGCEKVVTKADATSGRLQTTVQSHSFDKQEQWVAHVEDRHIKPIAWKLGDGPKGGVSDTYESEVSESYMSDSRGRRITPRVVIPDASAQPQQKKLTAAEKEAEQTRKAAENRNRDIGPGVDKEGATLVNDEIRRGLADSGPEAMVIDDDE